MIIKTKIDWLQNKVLTDEEKEVLEAKRIVLGDDYDANDEYDETEKNAIIDTTNDKIYIEIEPEKVCMVRLLDAQYVYTEDGRMERIEERLYLKSTLDEIFENLNK